MPRPNESPEAAAGPYAITYCSAAVEVGFTQADRVLGKLDSGVPLRDATTTLSVDKLNCRASPSHPVTTVVPVTLPWFPFPAMSSRYSIPFGVVTFFVCMSKKRERGVDIPS